MTVINYSGAFKKTSFSKLWDEKKCRQKMNYPFRESSFSSFYPNSKEWGISAAKIRNYPLNKLGRKSLGLIDSVKNISFSFNFIVFFIVVFIGLSYIWLIVNLISLDYQISRYKRELISLNEKISVLQEESSKFFSSENIISWAEINGFQEVDKISYLNLENQDLAKIIPD